MTTRSIEPHRIVVPAPRWAATAWLLAPLRSIGAEGDAELRQSLMRRLGAVVVSAVVTLLVGGIAVLSHPSPPLLCWLCLDVAVASVRVPLILHMIRIAKRAEHGPTLRPWVVDLFVAAGTLWSALLGVGSLLWLWTDDPGLCILAALVTMGTIGAQGVRSPGTPRLNGVQMCMTIVPFAAGCAFSATPLAIWAVVLVPLYLTGMMSITQQLHQDYVRMIVARIENRQRALHCPLTGLPNRAFFSERLVAALERAGTTGHAVAVLYLDLDGFKGVNDRLGHAAGDALLEQVADRLRDWKRPGTVVARLGGDEFAILLRTGDVAEIETAARALIAALGQPYDLGADGTARVGASIGLATGAGAGNAAGILMRADQALYAAKRAGKATFRWHDGIPPGSADLHEIARRMRAFEAPEVRAAEAG